MHVNVVYTNLGNLGEAKSQLPSSPEKTAVVNGRNEESGERNHGLKIPDSMTWLVHINMDGEKTCPVFDDQAPSTSHTNDEIMIQVRSHPRSTCMIHPY